MGKKMKGRMKERGFTLIELLLVVVIIGVMLAVIVPRAWRANVDAKYGMVRQAATELASVGVQWAENQLQGQDIQGSTAQLADYLAHIAGGSIAAAAAGANQWVAGSAASGWQATGTVTGRLVGGDATNTSGPAREMMARDRRATNPFNGQDVFSSTNDPVTANTPVPGAIASGYIADDELADSSATTQWYYYALRFQGTDSSSTSAAVAGAYHADMASAGLNGLRAGVFMARALLSGT